MTQPNLTKLELRILEALWAQGKASIREVQETFPEPRPALYDDSDNGIPAGKEASRATRAQDRQCPYF